MATTPTFRGVIRTARPGPLGLILEGFGDIRSRYRLAAYLVRADLAKKGANTILGNVWWVLDPLLQMAVYVVLVSVIFRAGIPDYPLFVFCAILPWKWFSSSVNDGLTSVTARERIIKQVNFPKIVLPVSATLSGIVSFAFGLIPLVGLLLLLFPHRIAPTIVLIPAVAVVQLVFTLAIAIALSAVNVFYRDLGNLVRHLLRIWFYLSPGLYSIDHLADLGVTHPEIARLLAINPFTILFEAYRDLIYDGVLPPWGSLAVLLGVSFVLLAGAILIFKRVEPAFAKVL